MKRIKRHKIKREIPESSSQLKNKEEHDLAYYIHDRVELMHQVFSVIKPKELKAMAPQCVHHISIDDLQELCTEELLGISSKRLCAILDGAEPPTDTESSNSEPLETISLDSISSDDAVLSQNSSKNKKHKHKKHKSKNKHKRRENNSGTDEDESKASRAGLTVLELLELQARARAIRAQLQQDVNSIPEVQQKATEKNDSSDEIEIKEEPPEVVEISSEDEKPNIKDLPVKPPSPSKERIQQRTSTSITKRVNDLIITVPQTKPSRKITLKRNRPAAITTTADDSTKSIESVYKVVDSNQVQVIPDDKKNDTQKKNKGDESKTETKTKPKKKQKKKDKGKEGSDHDEITLQLSESEKMDLLNFDRQNYDNLTSSGSEDSESSSDSSESDNKSTKSKDNLPDINKTSKEDTVFDKNTALKTQIEEKEKDNVMKENNEVQVASTINVDNEETIDKTDLPDTINEVSPVLTKKDQQQEIKSSEQNNSNTSADNQPNNEQPVENTNPQEQIEDGEIVTEEEKKLSDGEIPDHTSDILVCISDDEKKSKKKKKKEKKAKKDKKKKSKLDFREEADQNFYPEKPNEDQKPIKVNKVLIDDDIYEILELSDDSSCYEVEGVSISKEPTTAEIEALSAKIDEQIQTNTCEESEKNEPNSNEETENISWRDRYLDSTKVKKVLTTANILNALRKKNKELKKKLEESKNMEKKAPEIRESTDVAEESSVVEGSIDHFNTLQGSTKYVSSIDDNKVENVGKVTKELEIDAKRLLKMYRRLLKHNDMHKKTDPNKKKKKKQKKNKEKKKSSDTTQENIT